MTRQNRISYYYYNFEREIIISVLEMESDKSDKKNP